MLASDPLKIHLMERAMGIIPALAQVELDPRAGDEDLPLNIATLAASGLAKLLQARHGFTTATTDPQHEAVTSALIARRRAATKDQRGNHRVLQTRRSELGRRAPRPRRPQLAFTSSSRSRTPALCTSLEMWRRTVTGEIMRLLAISAVEWPT